MSSKASTQTKGSAHVNAQGVVRWGFPYPPMLGVLLVFITGFAVFQAWMVQRNLKILLLQAQAVALPDRVNWMVAGLWALVGGLVVFVMGAFFYRAKMRLELAEGGLLIGSWSRTQRIADEDVRAVEVYGSLWQGLRLVIVHTRGEERFPLLHGRAQGEPAPKRLKNPEEAKAHPLVLALAARYGWGVLTLRVRR